jgi:hypothetical protein
MRKFHSGVVLQFFPRAILLKSNSSQDNSSLNPQFSPEQFFFFPVREELLREELSRELLLGRIVGEEFTGKN